MCDLFLEHRRKKTFVRLLNEAGHRTRNGSRFTSKTVAEKERSLRLQLSEQQKLQQEITRVYHLYQGGQLDGAGLVAS